MKFNLEAHFTFSNDVSKIKKEIETLLSESTKNINTKYTEETARIELSKIERNSLFLNIISYGSFRPHNALLQIKNAISKKVGKDYQIGIREIKIIKYDIEFELEKEPLKQVTIPFAKVKIQGKTVHMLVQKVTEEFLKKNYIDRMINLVKEKVENQYYEGKGEFWKLIWESEKKKSIWSRDPTEEMVNLGWLKQGPTKGKWFYYSQITAILRAMEQIAITEVLTPLGFQEIIESHIVPLNTWLKTGHMGGMPGEFYYVVEPASRDIEKWQTFIDLTKITKEIPFDELEKNIDVPRTGICYAQCPVIYWSFKGKTISEDSLPILVYDKTAISARYESGGRHGIERVDEFHRIEPVYIGTKEQLLSLREQLLERYKHVFNNIFDLEWRMAWVTPWYMQQAGKIDDTDIQQDTGTIDFESYMPYRGSREESEWLEFQNLSILGDKYIKSFNIKAQKSQLWSGCSGIGLQRWAIAFLAQKGLAPEKWPSGFKKYVKDLPKDIKYV
jgi:seryl-tRNA synthetase